MDSPKVTLRNSRIAGTGVFALTPIGAGERIASFDGPFYETNNTVWTPDLIDHAIQCAPTRFRDSTGIARFVNHSCEPNCGIRGLFDIVTMRSIAPGEELTWDYEMTEDSDWWRMDCRCGATTCRKTIGAYRNLPEHLRQEYQGFVSEWLIPAPTSDRAPRCADIPEHGELLNTAACFPYRRQLHSFETDSLQEEFRHSSSHFDHWFGSNNLFYAAICERLNSAQIKIFAVISVFVADGASCARFVRGEIAEHQLEPWDNFAPASSPILYFSTIVCPRREWVPALYQAILSDLRGFQRSRHVDFHCGLTLASTPAGTKHLVENGFVELTGPSYLGRYRFLINSAVSAKSKFWVSLLSTPWSADRVAEPSLDQLGTVRIDEVVNHSVS